MILSLLTSPVLKTQALSAGKPPRGIPRAADTSVNDQERKKVESSDERKKERMKDCSGIRLRKGGRGQQKSLLTAN